MFTKIGKRIKKKGRGSYDFKVETENNISLIRWFDRKSINFYLLIRALNHLELVSDGLCLRKMYSSTKTSCYGRI